MRMTRLVPMLPVASMPASVEFYRKLGFSVDQRNDDWRWASLSFGECRLMLDESINVHHGAPRSGVLYLYPDDIAAYHRNVLTPEMQRQGWQAILDSFRRHVEAA